MNPIIHSSEHCIPLKPWQPHHENGYSSVHGGVILGVAVHACQQILSESTQTTAALKQIHYFQFLKPIPMASQIDALIAVSQDTNSKSAVELSLRLVDRSNPDLLYAKGELAFTIQYNLSPIKNAP